MEEGLKALGLSGLEAWLLKVVESMAYPSEMARHMGLPPPTVSHMLRRLEERGFVHRSLDDKDLRRFNFRLTEKGRDALLEAEKLMEAAVSCRLARLTPEETARLIALLGNLEES